MYRVLCDLLTGASAHGSHVLVQSLGYGCMATLLGVDVASY